MSDIDLGYGVVLIGPMVGDGHYDIAADGFRVPYLHVYPGTRTLGDMTSEPDPGAYDIHIDGRLIYSVPKATAGVALKIAANAMAVAAGWSCHGPNRAKLDPFGVRVQVLGQVPTPTPTPTAGTFN